MKFRIFLHLSSLFFVFVSSSTAEKLCGKIDLPTSLVKSKSPYLINGDIYVPPGARLTIESGVELVIQKQDSCDYIPQVDYADSQFVSIKIDGSFFIWGTPDEPVIIHPENTEGHPVQWDGIRIRKKKTSNVKIQYLRLSGANRGLNVSQSTFNISNSLFDNNNTGIYLSAAANINIFNNQFSNNISTGIYVENSRPKIYANAIVYNSGNGIWADSDPKLALGNNIFFGNGESDCFHCPPELAKLSTLNENGDSTDSRENLFQDPIFIGSKKYFELRKKDPSVPTPSSETSDPKLAAMEKETHLENSQIHHAENTLSKYSPAINAAPDNKFFLDENTGKKNIGMHGGEPDRVNYEFPF